MTRSTEATAAFRRYGFDKIRVHCIQATLDVNRQHTGESTGEVNVISGALRYLNRNNYLGARCRRTEAMRKTPRRIGSLNGPGPYLKHLRAQQRCHYAAANAIGTVSFR